MSQPTDNQARAQRPSRRSAVTDAKFNPSSLVGSWVHLLEHDAIVADGLVVAEPGPGIFLVELNISGRLIQSLHSIRSMIAEENTQSMWVFYDSDSEMRDAYAAWLVEREKA